MSQPHNTESRDHPADPREIAKWTRVYGQNRSLPLVVFLAFFLLLAQVPQPWKNIILFGMADVAEHA